MPDAVTLQARLAEAEAALHALATGRREVKVEFSMGDSSRAVTYTPADLPQLRAYIADLRRQLGQPSGRRAIGVRF